MPGKAASWQHGLLQCWRRAKSGADFDQKKLGVVCNPESPNHSVASSLLALGVMDCAELRACAAQYLEILQIDATSW